MQILDADPNTDWSKVDLEALRQHLIDMNEVTLRSDAAPKQIDGGLEIAITGNGRTLVAIQRMIPAYAQTVNGLNGWTAQAETLPNGELLMSPRLIRRKSSTFAVSASSAFWRVDRITSHTIWRWRRASSTTSIWAIPTNVRPLGGRGFYQPPARAR